MTFIVIPILLLIILCVYFFLDSRVSTLKDATLEAGSEKETLVDAEGSILAEDALRTEGNMITEAAVGQEDSSVAQAVTEPEDSSDTEAAVELEDSSITQEELGYGIDEKAETNITLVMVGDILLHDRVEKSAKTEEGFDFSPIFDSIREEVQGADLALVNQEVIIGGEELGISGYPAFNAPYSIGDELVETGFDVILHGTNHALDKGEKGIMNCLGFWEEHYPEISVVGIHDSYEDQASIEYVDVEGIRLGILNYTYGTNGIQTPEGKAYLVDYLTEERVANDLQEAEATADFTIVCPHWGTEYELGVTASQKKWTNIFYENGADLVIGTHPHVIEPIGWIGRDNHSQDEECKEADIAGDQGAEDNLYRNPDGMLVYYSLGNCVNWTSGEGAGVSNRMVGGMAKVTLTKCDEKTYISEYGITPIVSHVTSGEGGVSVRYLHDYSEEMAMENEIRSQDSSFSYAYLVNLCDEIWGELWD